MLIDNYINKVIDNLLSAETKETDNHLTPGMLGLPVQWQILNHLGVTRKPLDDYTRRRHKNIERTREWIENLIPDTSTSSRKHYGVCTCPPITIVDTRDWNQNYGTIPLILKPVSNANFAYIKKENIPGQHHILEAAAFALGNNAKYSALSYIALDDLRVKTYIIDSGKYKEKIDEILAVFNECLFIEKIPLFVPVENWQVQIRYNPYPTFSTLNDKELDEIAEKLRTTHEPDPYLTGHLQ